ncbi:MAG: hypothetical protein EXS10_09960 [Phycisphaerales bacterium]|nr:hypothetical protein [Phycisphaerales bacterium]
MMDALAFEVSAFRSTPHGAGAVATVELLGDVSPVLAALCGSDISIGALSLRRFDDIDEGLVARLAPERAILFPHGGTRIVALLAAWLTARGANWIEDPLSIRDGIDPMELFPEAESKVEAFAMTTLARAQSRLAVKLLLAQSARWNACAPTALDLPRSRRLNRLIDPPRVVLAGLPNAGKSSLSNRLLGRDASIVSPEAGTTRDAVASRLDLSGLSVDWLDLPGFRALDDASVASSEQRAIKLARLMLQDADYVIALAAPDAPWPALERAPDLRIFTKCDMPDARASAHAQDAQLFVSSVTGEGIDAMAKHIRDALVPPEDRANTAPWVFDMRLAPELA